MFTSMHAKCPSNISVKFIIIHMKAQARDQSVISSISVFIWDTVAP